MNGVTNLLSSLSSPWAYVLVGLLATAEAVFIGLVLPGELALLLGGFLAFTGRVSLSVMIGVAAVAAVAGYLIGYEIGRRLGPAVRRSRLGRKVGDSRWDRVDAALAARGGQAILLGRFVGLLRALMPAAAGAAGMPYRPFLTYTVLGGLVWAPGFVLLGYAAGGSYARVADAAGRASLVLFGVLAAAAAIIAAARWVAHHPDRVRSLAQRQLNRPRIATLRHRYPDQVAFLARRFSPSGAYGLTLTIGLITVVALGAAFGAVTEDVLHHDEIATRDSPVASWMARHQEAWLTTTMQAVTNLGGAWFLVPLIVVVAAVLLYRRRLSDAVLLVSAAAGSSVLVALIKLVIGRARPQVGDLLASVHSYAFPSGHSTQAVATYGALALLAGRGTMTWARRVGIWTAAALIALLIGFSRLYLGVHWLTDVLGGYALGSAWLAIVATSSTAVRRRANHRPGRGTPGTATLHPANRRRP
jgi:membrane protein DedA with SNARE-associated domain/membrane-associated phospholipid phosphatase